MELEAQNQPTPETNQETATEAAPQITNIDALSEFEFQGQKYTPEKLASLFQEHQKYSESHSKYSEHEKYLQNVTVDIETVLKDPSLAGEFKKTYPKQFHALLDMALKDSRQEGASPVAPQAVVPKEILSKLQQHEQKLTQYERMIHAAEVEKSNAYLQRVVEPLFTKYEYANPDVVYARAEGLINQGYKMTDAAWERLVKENHLAIQKQVESKHQAKVKEQLEKGNRAQDTGPGGAAPGQAPRKARTIAEATEEWAQSVSRTR